MELLRLFWENLLPIFLAAGAGYVLAVRLKVEVRPISHVGFYVLSPCLVFELIVENGVSAGAFLRMSGFAVAAQLLLLGATWLLARALRLSRVSSAAVALVVMLPNAGNFGMSANRFAFGEEALAHASLYFVTMAIVSYTVGVFVASMGRASIGAAMRGLLKVPTIWAVPLAFLLHGSSTPLPVPVERTVSLLADATIPIFLVILGMQLSRASWRGHGKALALAVPMRLLGGIAVGLLLSSVFGLQGVARQAGILETAMPSAVVNTILATEYDTEPAFVTMAVFATTILSPLSLTPLLAYLGA